MARIARIVLPGRAHLVCQKSTRPIFGTVKRRQAFLEILGACAAAYRIRLLAWSVLPNQVALVVIPPSAAAFSGFMRVVQARFTRRLHATGFSGEVTAGRFASCPLDNPSALEAIQYVEALPVVRGLAERPAQYVYGSAAAREDGGADGMLSVESEITGKVRNWAKRHAHPLPPERAAYLEQRLRTGKPAGETIFIRRVERKVGMNLSRPRGRPPRRKKR